MKGSRVLHVGVCYRTSGCQKDLRPVCASDPRTHKPTTYGNLCAAEKANATFLSNGTCN